MRNIIASLDIGSSLLKLVVGEINRGKFNILLAQSVDSQGTDYQRHLYLQNTHHRSFC